MIITDYTQVKQVYSDAAKKGWTLPCLCSENQTTTEAILAAACEFGKRLGQPLPVIIAITVNYTGRTQAVYYSNARDWETGLRLFKNDVEILAGSGGIYSDAQVLLHLDHIQPDLDKPLLDSGLEGFSSIMYDASALPFDDNIRLTSEFAELYGGKILIEGACDEINEATGDVHGGLTRPLNALRYMKETGVDMIVANLGTEHRAAGNELKYHADLAREIKELIGTNIVLHGASSVSSSQIERLFDDGVCKVNIWTALERESGKALLYEMVKNASLAGGAEVVDKLIAEGYLTEKCRTGQKINIGYFTQTYRNAVMFKQVKQMVLDYFALWYV